MPRNLDTVGPSHPAIGAVIVTHDSQPFIQRNVECILRQKRRIDYVVIVDSSSSDTTYLHSLKESCREIALILEHENVGFCRANNIGGRVLLDRCDYILFLNPDAFLESADFVDSALAFMEEPRNSRVAAVTGKLIGFDMGRGWATGRIDSTGIFRKWYGRWYDRGQGSPIGDDADREPSEVPAICGALMFCRTSALKEVLIRGTDIFDETYFMYKEDIDLSLRLRRARWKLAYSPSLMACHCRGWNTDRDKMPRWARLLSARNEIRLCLKAGSPYIVYALAKYAFVRWIEG